jgi:hypothetical protein
MRILVSDLTITFSSPKDRIDHLPELVGRLDRVEYLDQPARRLAHGWQLGETSNDFIESIESLRAYFSCHCQFPPRAGASWQILLAKAFWLVWDSEYPARLHSIGLTIFGAWVGGADLPCSQENRACRKMHGDGSRVAKWKNLPSLRELASR